MTIIDPISDLAREIEARAVTMRGRITAKDICRTVKESEQAIRQRWAGEVSYIKHPPRDIVARDIAIMRAHNYGDSTETIAARHNLTPQRVRQILAKKR
jgi:hypothetical protein